jgi:integral membrane protein (TIGR01906 family)
MSTGKKRSLGATPITDFLIGIVFCFLFVSLAVVLTLNLRPLYYACANAFDVEAASGLSTEDIRINYETLIKYNSVFFTGGLEFPTLPMSESARVHFEDVKRIFVCFQIVFFVSAALGAIFAWIKLKRRQTAFLIRGGQASLAVIVIIALLPVIFGWDRFFVGFHELLFSNDYWIFDPTTDPILLILPEEYFLACVVAIVVIVVVLSIASILIGRKLRSRNVSHRGV